MNNEKCMTDSCEEKSTPRTPYCKNCGANLNHWSHRRPAEVMERRRRLTLYGDRMIEVAGRVTDRKVTVLKTRRRA